MPAIPAWPHEQACIRVKYPVIPHKKLPTSSACMAASQFSALPTIRMMSCFLTTGLSPSPEPFSTATSPLVRVSSLCTATTATYQRGQRMTAGWTIIDTLPSTIKTTSSLASFKIGLTFLKLNFRKYPAIHTHYS